MELSGLGVARPAARAVLVAAAALLALSLAPGRASAQLSQRGVYVPEGSFQLSIGSGPAPGEPRDVAAGPDGAIHVVDREGEVFVYDQAGAYQRTYGSTTLRDPVAATIHPDGRAFVLDENRKRVYVFSPGGELVESWGGSGSDAGQLDEPRDLALGPHAYVYVLDKGQKSVHVFSLDGVFVRSLLFGDRIGDPAALAVAPDGTIFITDKDSERWIYSLPPFPEANWGAGRTGVQVGQHVLRGVELGEPLGVAVNRFGTVVVVDEDTGVLSMFNVQESQQPGPDDRLYGGTGEAPGAFREATAVAFATDDELVVLDRDLHKVERVRLTTEAERAELETFAYPIRVSRGRETLGAMVHAVGYDGDTPVFVSSFGERSIALVRAESDPVVTVYGDRAVFHSLGPESTSLTLNDGYDRVSAGALNDSLVVVTDRGRDRFSTFARTDGRWLGDFGRNYEDDRRLDDPEGVAVRPDGSVVVADRNNDRVVVISPDRTQKLAEFAFHEAHGVALSPDDRLMMWNEDGDQAYFIDLAGDAPARTLGGGGLLPERVVGAAFDDAGNLYVLDRETDRVTVLRSTLDRVLFQVGAHEEVDEPRRLAVDRDGNIYVGDEDGPRTVVYRWDVRADAPENVTVVYEDATAVLSWSPGPRGFVRHYQVEGAPGPGAAYRTLETPGDTVFRLEVTGVDDDFPRLLRVVPVFITGSAGEASEAVSIVDLTARVAFGDESWETAFRDAGRALARLDEGAEGAAELRWIRFRSARERDDHAEVVRLAETVADQVPEDEAGDFHLGLVRSHMALGNVREAGEHFRSAAAALDPERLRADSTLARVPFLVFAALDSAGAREEGIEYLRDVAGSLPDELAELQRTYRDSVQVFEIREALGEGLQALRDLDVPRAREFFEERLASQELRNERQVVVAMLAAAIAAWTFPARREAEEWFRMIYEDDPDFSFEESFDRMVRLYDLGSYDSPQLREFFLEIETEIREDAGGEPPGDPGGEEGGP